MSKINRRYIDKHWLIFILRGGLAALFGLLMLFNCLNDVESIGLPLGVFLLCMGAIDAVGSIYNSNRAHGWITSLLDSLIDVIAALALLFAGRDSLVASVVILAVYTLSSGLVDVFHGFLSTVDPTDRFIRVLVGVSGCVIGLVILNAGNFDVVEFFRFFGVYMLLVGVTSLIYGVHNRAQLVEEREALREMARERAEAKAELEATKQPRFLRALLAHGDTKKQAKKSKTKTETETKMPKNEEKAEHKGETDKVGEKK